MADAKQIARRIFQETLASIDIPLAMERRVLGSGSVICVDDWSCDLAKFSDVKVIALGKAAHAMLHGLAQLFSNLRFSGVASAPTPPENPVPGISYFVGGHPLPNEQSFLAAEAALTQLLVTCGASIDEINTIRKHASAVKGGRLAVASSNAAKLTLAISDVPLGKESALASGPTIPDPSTCADVSRILAQYGLREKLPPSLRDWFASGQMPETPKKNHPAFERSHFSLLLTSHDLFHAAHHAAEAEGFLTCCDNTTDDWPLDRAVEFLLAQLEDIRRSNPGHRVALISDGEVSSIVMGQGIGGRNSAFVLACVERIAGHGITVLSAGTDGIDGNSPAAGAVADGTTLSRAQALGLYPADFFQRSDSFSFFHKLSDSLMTGPTGKNLRDLRILLGIPHDSSKT